MVIAAFSEESMVHDMVDVELIEKRVAILYAIKHGSGILEGCQ